MRVRKNGDIPQRSNGESRANHQNPDLLAMIWLESNEVREEGRERKRGLRQEIPARSQQES